MELTEEEVEFLEASGTRLTAWESAPGMLPRLMSMLNGEPERYKLETDCGNLVRQDGQFLCAAYEDPRRPAICVEFAVGSAACRILRFTAGVDDEATFAEAMDIATD